MQPPSRRVLAIDPGFRTGCKLAALSEVGEPLAHGVAYLIGKPEKRKPKEEKAPVAATSPAAPAATAPVSVEGTAPASAEAPAASPESPPPSIPPASAATEAVSSASTEVAPSAAQSTSEPAPTAALETPPPAAAESISAPANPERAATEGTVTPEPKPPAPAAPEPPSTAAIRTEAKSRMADMIRKHNLNVVAIGNGTACRETEELTAELIGEQFNDLAYVIVNEAGASVYSASPCWP